MRLLQKRDALKDLSAASKIASPLGVTLNTAKLIMLRGARTIEEAKAFLYPEVDSLCDPFELKDMDKAVKTIKEHIDGGMSICILGDYDADGVTSTALLYLTLKHLGAEPTYYIPSRQDEGYGLTKESLKGIMKIGPDLLITVDCGVTSVDEVNELYDIGVSVIITDHHKCPDILPECEAVINPNRQDCKYPFKGLAGVGVAAKLCQALVGREFMLSLSDLVALGTVADLMPLLGENRVFVQQGLFMMQGNCNLGIKKLIEASGIAGKEITSREVAFALAPRVNAGGRISDNSKSVELFITEDKTTAMNLSAELNELNTIRQRMVDGIQKSVIEKLEANKRLFDDHAIIVADKNYNHTVIGIVASKLVEKYYRPAIIFGEHEGLLIGSARSIEGIDIYKALKSCSDLYERFGGHSQAAGLTIKKEHFTEFTKRINQYLKDNSKITDYIPKAVYDLELTLEDIDEAFINELDMLRPYGMANPRPDFYLNIQIKDCRTIGSDGSHLKFTVQGREKDVDGIAFSYGHMCDKIMDSKNADIICKSEINEWNGNRKVQLNASYIGTKTDYSKKLGSPWIFYDAMLDNVIYNYNVNTENIAYSSITLEQIKAIFEQSIWGNVIFCGSLQAYKIIKQELFNDFTYYDEYIGYINNSESMYNAVVYAPVLEKMAGLWFKNAVYLDCMPISKISQNAYIYKTKEKDDIHAKREALLKSYQILKTLDDKKSYSTYDQLYDELVGRENGISKEFLYVSIRIFKDLKLLKMSEGPKIRLEVIKGAKADLQDSILYKAINDLSR